MTRVWYTLFDLAASGNINPQEMSRLPVSQRDLPGICAAFSIKTASPARVPGMRFNPLYMARRAFQDAWTMKTWILVGLLFCPLLASAADPLTQKINLLNDPQFQDFTLHLKPDRSLATKKSETFSLEDGLLHISGKGFGYLRTNSSYEDYHLVLEYKWGEHTWSRRIDNARDAGVFVHCQPGDGAFRGTWPVGAEIQLIEGATGNVNLLGSEAIPAHLSENDGGAPQLKWNQFPDYRSASWTDLRGFRGPKDVESLFGDWNRLEVICKGSEVTVKLNGKVVNTTDELHVATGFVALQSEWAEWYVRRWELWPLGKFEEKWDPDAKFADTGSGANLFPRELPLSPEEAIKTIEVDGPFELELVAAEPLVADPVDVVWDAAGHMYVAEMRDYPLPTEKGPLLSRIRLLKDTDNDGRMDTSTIWADELDHVQGLLPVNGGLLATTRTAILHLSDTDGDEVADKKTVLFQSNDPRHSQLQISSPRWGVDGWIYLNNGLDGKEIYPGDEPEAKLEISRKNIRLNPRTWELEVVSGYGQFGGTLDDWGRRLSSTNRNPTIFAVMPLHAVTRNPAAALTIGKEDIAPFGGLATVYPLNLTHTTAAAHLGTHTAACGLGVYRGSLVPQLKGDVFVCEPPGQLITRANLTENGASLKAERVRLGKQTEFVRSSDEWFRPVNLRNGPDGALYICDMYRRFIDHSRFFPEEFSEAHYMRAGFDQGRIYRVVPKGSKGGKFTAVSQKPEDLVALLDSPDAWQQDTAQRLLIEKNAKGAAPKLVQKLTSAKSATARLHAMWTLQWIAPQTLDTSRVLQMLQDPQAEVVENAIELAESKKGEPAVLGQLVALTQHTSPRVRFLAAIAIGDSENPLVTEALAQLAIRDYADTWTRQGILSGTSNRTGVIFKAVVESPGFLDSASREKADFLEQYAAVIARNGNLKEMEQLFARFASGGEEGNWWQMAMVDGIADGMKGHRGDLSGKSLAALLRTPPESMQKDAAVMQVVVDRAADIAVDSSLPVNRRLAAIPMLRHMLREEALKRFATLIEPNQPPQIRDAAFGIAGGLDRNKLADLLFERWPELDPVSKSSGLELLVGNTKTAERLMNKMLAGEINPALMDTMSRWRFQRSSNEQLKALADELYGQPTGDRAEVMKTYHSALTAEGKVAQGKQLFTMVCSACHLIDGVGNQVGPDITDVRNKPAEALLSDILDPNRAVEARWTAYTVQTKDGRTLVGLVEAETADSVTLKGPGLSETIGRDQIESMTENGYSLMPVGLEGAITPEQMADLLAFLRKR